MLCVLLHRCRVNSWAKGANQNKFYLKISGVDYDWFWDGLLKLVSADRPLQNQLKPTPEIITKDELLEIQILPKLEKFYERLVYQNDAVHSFLIFSWYKGRPRG